MRFFKSKATPEKVFPSTNVFESSVPYRLNPEIPLYAGVLLTSLDVFIVFKAYSGEKRNKSIMAFEILISALVLTVLVSFAIPIARLQPAWATVFNGYLPSSTIVGPRALCISVGIIGATVMPHALFLGAKLGTIRRLEKKESDSHQLWPMRRMAKRRKQAKERLHLHCLQHSRQKAMAVRAPQHTCICQIMPNHAISLHMVHATPIPQHPFAKAPEKFQRTVTFVKTHLHHAQLDIAFSLFRFALVKNSAILIMAVRSRPLPRTE